MIKSTDTDPTPDLFAAVTMAIHKVTMEHPEEDKAERSARLVKSLPKYLQPWADDCLKNRPDEPLAQSVARMVVVAMVCSYDWLAGTIAEELYEAGIEIEPVLEEVGESATMTSPSGMVH